MKSLLICALLSGVVLCSVSAQCSAPGTQKPFAANLTADLKGEPDTRPDTHGTAGFVCHRIPFKNVPSGCRVRILRVYGDFVIVPNGQPGRAVSAETAGTLWGLQSTAPESTESVELWGAADNTFLYIQLFTDGKPARAPIDFTLPEQGGLLEADHVLVSKMAVFLNDMGRSIHMEPSFTIVFRYE